MPRIFIVLATYNGERFLSEFLDSLLNLTYKADRIIVIDDGSKDATVSILKSYEGKLPLQIYCEEKNQGHRAAFAKGLEIAQQQTREEDFIALADQDDIWLPQKLELLKNNIGTADLVFGDAILIDNGGETIAESWREEGHILSHLTTETLLTGFTNVTGCLTLFKASLLSTILPVPQTVPVHDQWVTFCAAQRNGYIPIPDKVVKYRIHTGNVIGLGTKNTWSHKIQTNQIWIKTIVHNAIFKKLSPSQQKFATEYYHYITKRQTHFFQVTALFWLWKHKTIFFPHCHTKKAFLPRVLFSMVGVPLAKTFFGKK